ncbi:MAG: dTMP kinase [Clostridiaceae bacterium]|jgi:dTMP kinase|nr:dTMP kinase [Clostridiaceae bacterium]
MAKKGLFITFEGADGCGKTTQLKLLAQYLEQKGREILITREPGGKGLGEKVREILLNYDGDVSPRCEEFLFLADRAQNIDIIVNPAIKSGKIVLCDRHTDSTIAYQGYGRGLDIDRIKNLNNMATNGRIPDLTFIFDIDTKTSMQRVGKEKDRMESAGIEFHNRVRQGYLEIAKQEPNRVKVLDATKSIEEIHKKVVEIVNFHIIG